MSERILIIKHGGFGDFIQAMGGLKAIRAAHPEAQITLLTIPSLAALGRQCPYFNEVVEDPRVRGLAWQQWRRLRALFSQPWARVYDLQNSDRTDFYFYLLTPLNIKRVWCGRQRLAHWPDRHAQRARNHTLERIPNQLALVGINAVPAPSLDWLPPFSSLALPPAPYALLVPGSAPHRPEKRWPAEHYAVLAASLWQRGITPVLLGTKSDAAATDAIAAVCPFALNLNGQTTLADIASLAQRAALVIGNDTGTMHVAAVMEAKTIVLFGKDSDPARCAPRGKKTIILQSENITNLSVASVLAEC